jgi:hypothetical protein
MAAELPRPGVEVIQVFRSVSPTVITPTLVPCVVGVSRQVVEVLAASSSGATALNNDALVPLQAQFVAKAATGSPPKYSGLDGFKLVFSVNNAPAIEVTFSGTLLTPAQVVAQVRNALGDAGNTTATAETVNDDQWRLRTYAANEFQSIEIDSSSDSAVLAAFGLGKGHVYQGASYYSQDEVVIPTAAFPNPRNNLEQLAIESSTIRAFLYMGGTGGSLVELRRDRSFLRSVTSTAAVRTGTVDITGLTYPTDPGTKTLVLAIDGGEQLTVTFANPANATALLAAINAIIGDVAVATLATGTNYLVITSLSKGATSSVQIVSGTALVTLGLTANTVTGTSAVEAVDDGNGDAVTPLIKLRGQNLTASGSAAVVTGTIDVSGGVIDGTLTLDDGQGPQTITFTSIVSGATLISAINAVVGPSVGGRITASLSGNFLRLTHALYGLESKLVVVSGSAGILAALGLTAGTTYGGAYPAKVGDELYVDGVFYANITQVAPGAVTTTVKIDKQVPISNDVGRTAYIIAKNLPAAVALTRPTPDLVVGLDGSVTVKMDLLRDTAGNPVSTSRAQIALSYKAVRKDVTAVARNPALLRFSDTVALSSQLSPVNTDNPLALGLYFALLNAPGTQVTGLGVDEATPAAPEGTVEGFTRAATFLEAYEVYAVAPMTHDRTVGQVFSTHATVMSSPENKGERIALFNPAQPTTKLDTLVASGTSGNSTGSTNVFDTGIANLGALLLAQGLDPTGSFLVEEGLYLDVGDGSKYSITSVAGGQVTVKTSGFLPGDNDDGYYATSTLSNSIIDGAFAVRIRGASLTLTDGTIDKEAMAVTYQAMAQSFLNRRFWHVVGPQAAATIGGLEQLVEGFYLCAAVAGMIGQNPPQQSFTNFPMTGFTRVIGTNGFLTERQLDVVAAGGNYIIVQDDPSAPLISRMALTSDVTSIETRTDSITKVVDFCAKFLRRGLKNFIGRFNITQGFLDSLGHVIQGLLGFLAESGVLIGSNLNNIIQDEDAPDTVLVDITLDVPFPCNYIRLTLVI